MPSAAIVRDVKASLERGDKIGKENISVAKHREMMNARARALVLDPTFKFEETKVDGVRAYWVTPPEVTTDIVYLFFHGGAYVKDCVEINFGMLVNLGKRLKSRMLTVDYRVAPENPFPVGLGDAMTVYRALLRDGIPANRIVVSGSSAGGGLALALMLACRDEGIPQPGAVIPVSGWTDLTQSGESMVTRHDRDPALTKVYLDRFAADYYADMDPKTPGISPVFADYSGITSAILAQVGSEEILLDDSTRVVEKAKAAGVAAECEVYEGGFHGWQNAGDAYPEAGESAEAVVRFIDKHIGLKAKVAA